MIRKTAFILLFLSLLLSRFAFSQMSIPNIALSGGPVVGWDFNNTTDLNAELKKAGFPQLSTNGFFSLGGNGFIDIEWGKRTNAYLRFGGMGIGFTSHNEAQVNDTLSKAVTYNFGMGGISVEYVKSLSSVFDITFGALFTTGTLKIDLYQYGKDFGNYNSIFGELTGNSASGDITRNFKVRFYSVEPQVGIGVLIKKAFYLRLQAGYNFAALGSWKVDNDIVVSNFPAGIKANGFKISLGVNFGLFFRDN
jgi:hypothetical protein